MKRRPLDIAHRGASAVAPENTKTAFLEAIKAKADVVEFDIQSTKDGKLVVIHDPAINRTSNGFGLVRDFTLKELRKYNFGIGKFRESILTLEEALRVIGKKAYCIVELKHSIKGHEETVLGIINKSGHKNKIWIHSAHRSILRKVRSIDKEIKLGLVVIFSFFHRILLPSYRRFHKKYNIGFFSVDEIFINKPFVKKFMEEISEMDAEMYIWTVNSLHGMYQGLQWEADGIITNYPGVLRRVMRVEK